MTTSRTQARLICSASESDANMLWATQFFAPDPSVFVEKRGKRYLVMSDLEMGRAKDQANVDYAGMGGVRLEDVVLFTKTGCRNLVRIAKILEV